MPEGRVELPVHGMNDDMGVGVGRGIRSENSVDIGIRNGVGRAIGGAIGSGIGIGKMAGNGVENGVGVGVRNGIYGHERWDSSLTRIESPLSPISSLSLLGGSRSRTGVVSPTGIERVDVGAGFASAVGVALAAATEVGERCSLGRDIREGMSPVEIGPGIEVVAEKEEKEDGKTGQSTKQEVKEKWKEREKQERE
jgi:hypothetical protein